LWIGGLASALAGPAVPTPQAPLLRSAPAMTAQRQGAVVSQVVSRQLDVKVFDT